MDPNVKKEIKILINAKYPLIYIISWEEERVEALLKIIAEELGKKLYIWSCTKGICELDSKDRNLNTLDPYTAIVNFLDSKENAIYVFKDLHVLFKNEPSIRLIKDAAREVVNSKKNFIILSPVLELPQELSKHVVIFDFPLPDYKDLEVLLNGIIETAKNNKTFKIKINNDYEKELLIKAALGLTLTEAENVFSRAIVDNNELSIDDIDIIIKEKQQLIRKSGILEYLEVKEELSSVGGLDVLKEWIKKRGRAFTQEARNFGLPEPKGILLLGVQGCGKSLSAKVIASAWKLPILRLDVGAIFSKWIGESESNIRKTITMAESIAPVILWIDEIEKAFAGVTESSDSGTSSRVFGTMLTWLQEKTKPVFVIATSNDVSKLPPELIRKGRFDEIFFVDLPNEREREEIFKIHLLKRKKNIDNFNLKELAKQTNGFSGAEIEQVVISALYDAFDEHRDLIQEDLIKNINNTIPLSVTAKEKIEWLKNWAKARAINTSRGDKF